MTIFNSKNDEGLQALQQRNKKNHQKQRIRS